MDSAWLTFWQAAGDTNTFGSDDNTHYETVFGASLFEVVKTLDEDSMIIELCCGNAPLLQLVEKYEIKCDKSFIKLGVDKNLGFAERKFGSIQIYGNQDVLKLPQVLRGAKCIVSVFGIEYAGVESVLKTLKHLLDANASLLFFIHSSNSYITKNTLQELEVWRYLLDTKGGLFSVIDGFGEYCAVQKLAEQLREGIGQRLRSMPQNIAVHPCARDILMALQHLLIRLIKSGDCDAFISEVAILKAHCVAAQERANQQSASALSEYEIRQLVESLKKLGYQTTDLRELRDETGVVAWQLLLSVE